MAHDGPRMFPDPNGREDRREHARRSVVWSGQIRIDDNDVSCVVHDISEGGARLRAGTSLTENDRLMLRIEGVGEIAGRVAWRHGDMIGIRFLVGSSYVTRMIVAR